MSYEQAQKKIEEAQADGSTSLYLRNNQLTTLPPEIGQLKSLTKLYLGDNQLTDTGIVDEIRGRGVSVYM